ncbi:MAG: hypothetical protein A2504_00085 [Bdellovibrionales bacterium RIFOXYD12_FULL_39_22]|nr:MAG: hypothetical protein A2385_14940 [Bdellovibrionales bacterium RIFOXYB1_FULL_39_21]OFZ43737.1 MAG: hypothetical protein A2485_07765 [Bdellovibrionales bacterium RIFOXYC12_FULL_39_17]OFZ48092.1 MAG: hypothetical protein A2404_15725 [Bdellovibrionales bacterium RIFOXYC1_FULL_39_130]OFZ77245.1 MAG: hypothetical protein A2560_08260 [Bdellovibrionales bacterium RIFOXYD1_FULL_39_84]OFZ95695.1 MAG: hypothetical protein A2504_00085 [Bdellovibrionales bacterium RIFOXYD12_FULL_39_22]HLE11465.1 hy
MKGLMILLFLLSSISLSFLTVAQEEFDEVDYSTPAQTVCDSNGENCVQDAATYETDQADPAGIPPTINVYEDGDSTED